MGLGLKISIEGDKTLTKAIEDIDFKARSPRPFYLMFGAYMKRIVPRSVREQADPVTLKKWPSRSGLSLQSRRGAGGNTLADTGALVRSFAASPTVTQNGVSIGSSLKYALIHQKGGIIRAKKKYLTIPLEAAARKFSGIRAWFAAQEAKGRDPFFYRSKSGKVFAAYTKNKKTKALAFAWLLTPQVKIPQRRYLGFGKRDKEHFVELARQFFKPKTKGGS